MKLSTAAVIIAAGTSNVFSPNVVLAGKAGKLAPKASKAKTAKAHPSLSYGSGSYSMSTGPSPPSPTKGRTPAPVLSKKTSCPCFVEGDLAAVTENNVDTEKSDCDGKPWRLEKIGKGTYFETAFDTFSGEYYCDRSGFDPRDITTDEYVGCMNLIINRCTEVGYPW